MDKDPPEKGRYIDLMNLGSPEEAYVKIKELASDLTDDQHLIRSCIFDLHAALEIELRRIYFHTFKKHLFLTDNEVENEKLIAQLETAIGRLSYTEMYRVLKVPLNSWPYPDFDTFPALNETRNSAAHGANLDKVRYKGRNPFKDADCFAQMYFDVWAVKQSIPKYFWHTIEKMPAVLQRYVKKYGSGEL